MLECSVLPEIYYRSRSATGSGASGSRTNSIVALYLTQIKASSIYALNAFRFRREAPSIVTDIWQFKTQPPIDVYNERPAYSACCGWPLMWAHHLYNNGFAEIFISCGSDVIFDAFGAPSGNATTSNDGALRQLAALCYSIQWLVRRQRDYKMYHILFPIGL